MKSVNKPTRGHWVKAVYGNTSGYIIKEMIEHFKPAFVDAKEGHRVMFAEKWEQRDRSDLYKGNDFTKDSIIQHLPRPADICFTHPPYHNMVVIPAKSMALRLSLG